MAMASRRRTRLISPKRDLRRKFGSLQGLVRRKDGEEGKAGADG
jgi:hypothetical protein